MGVTEMRLEQYSENDRALYECLVFNRETMMKNLGRIFTEEEAAFFFRAVLEQNSEGNEYGFFKVFVGAPDKEEYIGMGAITLNDEYEAPEIEYMLLPQFWNKGYGTELVEVLLNMVKGSSKIVAITDPENTYSRRILLKKGFESVKQYRNDDDEPAELFILKRPTIVLRDMRYSDIEDYVRWFTVETEWMHTDAPWEKEETTPESERSSWTEYYDSVRKLSDDAERWKYELEFDGKHIGWVSSYVDLDYVDNPGHVPAVGIDIPVAEAWNKGVGTQALQQFLGYLKKRGYKSAYTQTWSGNHAMLRVAEKLGFTENARKKDYRMVDGKLYDAITLQIDL